LPDNKQDQEPNGEELEARLAEKENELVEKNSRISELEQALASRDDQIADLKQSVANLEQRLTEAEESLSQAISSYRALVIKTNPGIPEEQIVGESIEEIEASLASARALIDRVRQELEAEIAAAKIPAGAPLRTPADLSALSPRDKIQYAIGERR
jgi:uncharacterized coiled-coil protein SlyX